MTSQTGPAAAEGAPQFEVIPLPGIVDQVAQMLPAGSRVTVTASPAQGLDATLEAACALARCGFTAIPHLAARMLHDGGEVGEHLARLTEAGIAEVFVIAGDAPHPAGSLHGALDLLEVLAEASPGLVLGAGTHPEGHPFVDEAESLRLLREKARYVSYLVTQMCFEAEPLLTWRERLHVAGIGLPLRPGLAAGVGTARLLSIGPRIGVGRSLRMLSAEGSGVRRLLAPGRWDPAPLLEELRVETRTTPGPALLGPHLYTFNDLRAARDALR
ncbi:5,10-methylenetetrahydrofolate reductase [Brachybacterium ginsengisoli]|uniref:Methylenetetrahydrofolate reductase n=1 Tax=Brachybacterium ginsengisoli TaxID=1331682 RepID=A0A291H219_9MICO|nr:methylenetetrahydrofolate reductase [Brachybacterium ginsengisoli]ATG56518.1 5,10-methylenetetrahydrofolate reductase [Brachybacterium ginsengisoli]